MISINSYSLSSAHVSVKGSVSSNEKKIKNVDNTENSPKTKEIITKLEARDTEVRAHEAAHMAAGGSVAGGASFDYQIGPNGKAYAVGGEVPIDISPEDDPKATQSKMQKVKAAALAPASPSPQDIKVAATASMIEMKAKMDELKENSMEVKEGVKKSGVKKYEEALGSF